MPIIFIVTSLCVARTTASYESSFPDSVTTVTRLPLEEGEGEEEGGEMRVMDLTPVPARTSGSSLSTLATYVWLRPLTTLHRGRWKRSRRWWLAQNLSGHVMGEEDEGSGHVMGEEDEGSG